VLVDRAIISVIRGPKCHFFENLRWRRPPSWKIHKRAYLGQSLIDLHLIWCACRYGQYKCHQGSKMSLFETSRWRKIHKRAYLGQFLTNLHQNGQFKCHQRQKSTFRKLKMAAAAILKNTQMSVSQPILYRFTPNLVCL